MAFRRRWRKKHAAIRRRWKANLRRFAAPYLVLDEFSERGASEWDTSKLNNIIDHRYDAMLATVIIANVARGDVGKQVSASILSRAEETGGLVICDWPSYRRSSETVGETRDRRRAA